MKEVAEDYQNEDYMTSNATFESRERQVGEWIRYLILLRSNNTRGASMSCRTSRLDKGFQEKRQAIGEETLNMEITVGIQTSRSYDHYGPSRGK